MPTSQTSQLIRNVLLASPHVGEIRDIVVDAPGTFAAVRFTTTNLDDAGVDALPPLFAQLRANIREEVPGLEQVFFEPDFTGKHHEDLPTEAIVILGSD